MRQVLLSRRWVIRHVAAIVLIVVFLRLGWWQWQRAESAGGDLQNLGYALEWPLFAAFVGFFWYRMLMHELHPPDPEEAEEPESAQAGAAGLPHPSDTPPRQAATDGAPAVGAALFAGTPVADEEPDDELAAYNRYLAWLYANDQQDAADRQQQR